MPQKLAAARACDVRTVLIARPDDDGMSIEELMGTIAAPHVAPCGYRGQSPVTTPHCVEKGNGGEARA